MVTRTLPVAGLVSRALLGAGASAQEACRANPIMPVVPFPRGGLGAVVRRVGKLD